MIADAEAEGSLTKCKPFIELICKQHDKTTQN